MGAHVSMLQGPRSNGGNRDCELTGSMDVRSEWISLQKASPEVLASEAVLDAPDKLIYAGRRAVVVCGSTPTTYIRNVAGSHLCKGPPTQASGVRGAEQS